MAEKKIYLQQGTEQTQHELPVLSGTLGPDVIDIRRLYAETGLFTYDPGFTSTASCTSKITYHRRRRRHAALSRLSHRTIG